MEYLYNSPLGPLTIVSDSKYITQLLFSAPEKPGQMDLPIEYACNFLDSYFSGKRPSPCNLPIKLWGTAFQQDIWHRVLAIPYGAAVTYGQLAKAYANDNTILKMSAQAIGQAISANPIPIIIPCHRVIGADGTLKGYAYGIEKKVALLTIENHKIIDDTYLYRY